MARKSSFPLVVATIALGAISFAHASDAAPAPAPTDSPAKTEFKKKMAKPAPPPPATGVATPNSGMAAFDPAKRLATLTTKLNLTAEQQAKLKPVLEETQAKVQAARGENKMSNAHDKVKVILEDADKKFRAILDGAQWEQWEQMKEQVKATTRATLKVATTD